MTTANSYVMMALGDFRFSLDTAAFQELERNSEWRWASIDRIGARPSLQYIGPGEDCVSMNGTIFPHYRGGLSQVTEMREAAAAGEPLSMIDGTGRVWGKFVITGVREGQSIFFSNGQPRSQTFGIELKMSSEDAMASDAPDGSFGDSTLALIGTPDDAIDSISNLDDQGDWLARVSSTTLLSSADARSFLPLTTDGLARIGDAIQIGASSLSDGSASPETLRRGASALVDSFGHLLTPGSLAAFSNAGIDLNSVISSSDGLPFDAMLSAMKSVAGSDIAAAVTRDPDMTTVYRGLMDALDV